MNRRVFLVTGSASGIGEATATLIERNGDTVIRADLHNADIEIDLSTDRGRQVLVREASRSDRIDAVLAIAGGGVRGVVETNYFGAIATLEGLRPKLSLSIAPRAVVVSSTASLATADIDLVEACLRGDEQGAVEAAKRFQSAEGFGSYGSANRRRAALELSENRLV